MVGVHIAEGPGATAVDPRCGEAEVVGGDDVVAGRVADHPRPVEACPGAQGCDLEQGSVGLGDSLGR